MGRQRRKSVSMAPDVYAKAKAQAGRLNKPVARWVTEVILGALDPDLEASKLCTAGEPGLKVGDPVLVDPEGRVWRTG